MLPRGAVGAIKAARVADENDPTGAEAMGTILAVMRGKVGRHSMARLSAAREYLDRRRGRPKQAVQLSGSLTLEQLVASAGDPELPNPDADPGS